MFSSSTIFSLTPFALRLNEECNSVFTTAPEYLVLFFYITRLLFKSFCWFFRCSTNESLYITHFLALDFPRRRVSLCNGTHIISWVFYSIYLSFLLDVVVVGWLFEGFSPTSPVTNGQVNAAMPRENSVKRFFDFFSRFLFRCFVNHRKLPGSLPLRHRVCFRS